MSKTLANRLRAARKAMHPAVTQREIAKRFRVTPGTVSLWETGSTEPRADHIAELSRIYKVSSDWLLGVDEARAAKAKGPPLFTVPVVPPISLLKWRLEPCLELLQTVVLYPPGTAAAMIVHSDALMSSCPTGAYAVISKAHPFDHGCIVLAAVGRVSEPILRKLVREGRDELLLADDARWPTVRLNDGARILGRVVEVTIRRSLM